MYNRTFLSASILFALATPVQAQDAGLFDEVVVSATRTEQSKQDVSSSIETVSSDDIDAQLAKNLHDALIYTPGVNVTTSSRFGISGFNIRGMEGSRVKVVVDGVSQVTPFNPGANVQAIYPNTVELDTLTSIEINKGASSTLYGSDALGGTVVLRTKQPADVLNEGDGTHFGIKSSYFSADTQFKNTLTWAMRKGIFETIVIGTYADGNELQTYSDDADIDGSMRGTANPADKKLSNLLAKAYLNIGEHNRVGVVYEQYKHEYDENNRSGNYTLNFGPTPGITYSNSRNNDEATRSRVGLTHDFNGNAVLFDSSSAALNFQVSESINSNFAHITDHTGKVGYSGNRTRERIAKEETVQFDAQFDKLLVLDGSTHEITYGLNFQHTDFSLNNVDYFHDNNTSKPANTTVPNAKTVKNGLFIQNNAFLLDESLVVNAGVRYDSFETTPEYSASATTKRDKNSSDAITGKIGAVYHYNANISNFAQVSQGFKAPTVEQLYYEYNTGADFVPNPDLKAERSTSYETGLRAKNSWARIELVGFVNQYKDFIDEQDLERIDPNKERFTIVNRDRVEIKGLEFSSDVLLDEAINAPRGMYSKLTISYAKGKDKSTGKALDSVAPLTTVIGLGYDNHNRNFGGIANVTLVDSKDDWSDEDSFDSAGYGVMDIAVYYKPITDLTLRAGINNVFDKEYWTYQDVRDITSSNNKDMFSQPGRNWAVSVDYKF
ncbi:TPA: TonB-dependent hemoglobin/transferrin/lactoferrin family receptor [Vibrio vulnificus]|nr:TonB-dependent hemoglobin/transferrin/lactoferrin family receptor [Vibrio vulnificus]